MQESTSSDDDRAELPELEIESEEDSQMARATQAGGIEISQRKRDVLDLLRKYSAIACCDEQRVNLTNHRQLLAANN